MNDTWNTDKQEVEVKKEIKVARGIIAFTLFLVGGLLLFSQLFPVASSYLKGKFEEVRASILATPIPDSQREYIFNSFAYYDPGQSYFRNLYSKLNSIDQSSGFTYDPETKENKKIKIDREYIRDMQLTITSLNINKVKITPNVDSYNEDVYNLRLKSGLAHFRGTPLPGDGGNSFIYGHSAVLSFFNSHQDLPETIFTKLEKIEIGDKVIVFKDGKELSYTVRKKRTVEPDDFSVLETQGNKETVTLMTCWPVGVPTKRLIVLAERNE